MQRRGANTNSWVTSGGEYTYKNGTNKLISVANEMGGTSASGRIMSDPNNFVYDSEGNLTEDKSKDLKILYDWRGMPIEFIQEPQPTGSSGNSLFRLTMAYDGSGRRISKTRWVKSANSQEWEKELVTHYTGIGTEIRENYAGPAKQTKVVVNMPQGLGRYGIEDAENPDMGSGVGYIPNTKFEWYLKNHLGSTMLVYGTQADANPAHSDIGTPLAAYDYRAFGEMIELTPPPTGKVTENFTGKELDDEIALDYFGARYLDPMLGMWISVDPKRQFTSPYLYAGNGYNPVNVVDPDGNITIPKPHPLAVFSGVALGIANCAQIQYAYESNGGKDYMTEVALGFSAYMLTVAFSVIGINTDNIMKASMTSGAINAFTSGGFNAAIQYFTTGTVNTYDVGTEMAKGAITGMIGGAVSYGLSEYWGGNLKSPLTGEHIYPESGAMAGLLGDGTVQVLMNVIEMENTNAKQESVMDEK